MNHRTKRFFSEKSAKPRNFVASTQAAVNDCELKSQLPFHLIFYTILSRRLLKFHVSDIVSSSISRKQSGREYQSTSKTRSICAIPVYRNDFIGRSGDSTVNRGVRWLRTFRQSCAKPDPHLLPFTRPSLANRFCIQISYLAIKWCLLSHASFSKISARSMCHVG